ncbi:hypothetical protein [Stenotrophomonas maltophilia]|uniref:hypothetical protein n=1 Tax=Stenotrophomonas maltophilia TaxID=40324 RepID=UPI000ACEFC2F|nr:hypothetical protein [Stenotrophomonas maltophilia]
MPQPPPPVPAKLLELLKDYPDHIEQLQKALISVSDGRQSYAPPFEAAVWLLEDCLSAFKIEARAEMDAAEASGDSQALERAKEKERLMSFARSSNIGLANLSQLRAYFDANVR